MEGPASAGPFPRPPEPRHGLCVTCRMTEWPARVEIREVGPRDGLQNEAPVPVARAGPADRRALGAPGCGASRRRRSCRRRRSRRWPAPSEVMAGDRRAGPGVVYSALVPNAKGAERAIAAARRRARARRERERDAQPEERAAVGRRVARRRARRRRARRTAPGIAVEAIVSTAFGCPYEGDVAPERVAQLAGHLVDAGADRLSFGDTTGMATPRRVDDLLDALERAGHRAPSASGCTSTTRAAPRSPTWSPRSSAA